MKHLIPLYNLPEVLEITEQDLEFNLGRLEEMPIQKQNYDSPHMHDYFAAFLFTKGGGSHTIDFQQFEIKPPLIFFLKPYQAHSWRLSSNTKGYGLKIRPQFYDLYENKPNALTEFSFFQASSPAPVLSLGPVAIAPMENDFLRLLQEGETTGQPVHKSLQFALIKVILLELERLYNNTYPENTNSGESGLLRQLEALIDEYFFVERRPAFYADRLAITANHLNALCRKHRATTAGQLIRERLLLESKRLLFHSDLSITQIAGHLQFNDNAYFSRFFKKHIGLSPEKFRQNR